MRSMTGSPNEGRFFACELAEPSARVMHRADAVKSVRGSVFIRRASCHFLEPAAEMLRIREPQFTGYFADGFLRVEYALFGCVQHFLLDMLQRGHSGLFLQ